MSNLPVFSSINLTQFPLQLEQLLNTHLKKINDLLATQQTWTWENLIQPLEDMDDELARFWSPLSHMHAVVNTHELRNCYQACLPKLSAYDSTIGHNNTLYNAIRSIQIHLLSPTQQKIIHDMLRSFELSGVSLPPGAKKRFETISEELSKFSNLFETNILDAENHYEYWITNESELDGLPAHTKHVAHDVAKEKGKQGWCLTLAHPCYHAVLTYADDRNLRQTIYYAFNTRASDIGPQAKQFDNTEIINNILALRYEEAQLLGFDHYSDYSLATKMATHPQEVLTFLTDLCQRAYPQAQEEFNQLKAFAKTHCNIDTLEPWDIAYVSQKKKQVLFALTDETLRPYFPFEQVMQGLLHLLKTVFGITFEKVTQPLDSWHREVSCYQVMDEEHNTRGYLYFDLFARPNKRGGAWMDSLQSRRRRADGTLQLPIATLTCNFARPIGDAPPTLTHDEVITLCHELGHCLHHVLTTVDERSASGIHGVEWDAVELPSQFFENWCWERESLQTFSAHVDTQAPISNDLFDQLLLSKNFQSAMSLVRQLEFALFDFQLHHRYQPNVPQFVETILAEVRNQTTVIPVAPFNRFQHSFSHIFAGGYAAGYYSYLWAEVLSSDAFARFQEEGIFNTQVGHDFLHTILEVGGSRRMEESFLHFRGRAPRIDALLKHHGIEAVQ